MTYRRLTTGAATNMRAGRWRTASEGRRRRADDAEPAGISRRVARHRARRRRHRASQHQPHRHRARPLRQHRQAEACHRRRRAARKLPHRATPHLAAGPQLLVPRRGSRRLSSGSTRSSTRLPDAPIPDADLPRLTIEDKCLYVYTSGTTGLPKAANINHYRVQSIMFGFNARDARCKPGRPRLCLPADVPHVGRRARALLGADGRRQRGAARALLRLHVLGRHRQERLHGLHLYRRALPLSPEQPAASAGDEAQDPARLRQRAQARHLGRLPEALPHPEDPRMVRGDGGQLRLLQFRRQGRRDRPHPEMDGEQVLRRDRALRHRHGGAGARAGRLLRQMRAGRGRRGDLQDHERPEAPEPELRGLRRSGRDGEEDPARRLREGRPLVPHRRPHAQGRRRLLLFRRPDRRHLPLEGRERRHLGGAGGHHRLPRHRGGECLRRARAGRGGPRRHGRARRRRRARPRRLLRAMSSRRLAGYARPVFLRIVRRDRHDLDLQAAEARSRAKRASIRSASDDPLYFLHPELQSYIRLDPAIYADICEGKVRL